MFLSYGNCNINQEKMNVLEMLTSLGVLFGPALIISGIMYPINRRKKARRILQIESEDVNETVQFVGDRTFLGVIDMMTFMFGFTLGALLSFGLDTPIQGDITDVLNLAVMCIFLLALFLFPYFYKETPLVVFTLHKVYLFPWYGFSSVYESYDLEALQWGEENAKNSKMICLYAGEERICNTQGMPKGVDDFVREHVKPKEA